MRSVIRQGIFLLALCHASLSEAKWSTMPNPNYVPPGTPNSQTAVLSTYDDTGPKTLTVTLKTIDGQKYKCPRGYPNCSFLVRLTPGRHQIGLRYMNMNGFSTYQNANVTVDVDLDASTVYVLRVTVGKDGIVSEAKAFVPGTPYTFPPFPMRDESSLEGLFEEQPSPTRK